MQYQPYDQDLVNDVRDGGPDACSRLPFPTTKLHMRGRMRPHGLRGTSFGSEANSQGHAVVGSVFSRAIEFLR